MSSMTNITVYSNHCPSCTVLVGMLQKKELQYEVVDNESEVRRAVQEAGTDKMPLCRINGESGFKTYREMFEYINSL